MRHKQLSIFDLQPQKPKNSVIDKIKAISIHAPHAYAICLGKKPYEYRNSPTKKRGWVLIHSSGSKASDPCFDDYGISKNMAVRQAIIGASFITDCSPDYHGGYAYRMTRSMLFPVPILGIKGCQTIFWGHCKDPQKIKAFEQALDQMGIDLKTRE